MTRTGAEASEFLLPLDLPPMEARLVDDLPEGPGWQFEPKWDAFRCLAFRAGDEVEPAASPVMVLPPAAAAAAGGSRRSQHK